jgi:protein-tyrosine phosphatase
MSQVLNWHTEDPTDVVRRAVETLSAGGLVALPTETVYGVAASALAPAAVGRLRQSKGRPGDKPFTLAVGRAGEALDWVPGMSRLGRRLARRCWPGPVTLVFGDRVGEGLVSRLPGPVRRWVAPDGTLGLRVPAHEAALEVLRRLPGPLVLTSANASGEPPATTAEQVVQAVGDAVDLVIDAGPSHYAQASTVVKVDGGRFEVLREGVVSAADLERLSPCLIIFVCTGNTCRSPLAEALCKQLLAERLGCAVDELPRRGFLVQSAGLAAAGGPAAAEAEETARELGADLSGHSSRPLTAELAAQADYLVAMTRSHLAMLAGHFGDGGPELRLLDRAGQDVADPIGCNREVYRACARQIRQHLEGLVPELQQP